jgi:hypothetical protein
MSKRSISIASILLIIILIAIGIGIGIATATRLAVADLHLSATASLGRSAELRGFPVSGRAVLLKSHLKELATTKEQLLHVDVLS